jgi:hypothetical protein
MDLAAPNATPEPQRDCGAPCQKCAALVNVLGALVRDFFSRARALPPLRAARAAFLGSAQPVRR